MDFLHKFIALNNIEASYLISKNICEYGIVYDELKRMYKTQFAIIDLKDPVADGNLDEYSEVVELLRNNVWSNVNVGKFKQDIFENRKFRFNKFTVILSLRFYDEKY